MIKSGTYKLLWRFFDGVFDLIVVLSILITAIAGLYEVIELVVGKVGLQLWVFDISNALKVALNSVLIVKIYETLKLFISHEDLSLHHIIELGLIGLGVKMFFDDSFLTWDRAIIFGILFICYMTLRRYDHHVEHCDIHTDTKHHHKH